MKAIWEASDVRPGRRVATSKDGEKWIIGYRSDIHGEDRYVLISERDGMVASPPRSKQCMSNGLTSDGYLPMELIDL